MCAKILSGKKENHDNDIIGNNFTPPPPLQSRLHVFLCPLLLSGGWRGRPARKGQTIFCGVASKYAEVGTLCLIIDECSNLMIL